MRVAHQPTMIQGQGYELSLNFDLLAIIIQYGWVSIYVDW